MMFTDRVLPLDICQDSLSLKAAGSPNIFYINLEFYISQYPMENDVGLHLVIVEGPVEVICIGPHSQSEL